MPESIDFSAVIEAWFLLWACRIGLWFAPFPRVLAAAQYCASRERPARPLTADEAVRSIARALPYSVHASCLTQALVGWILLTRHGTESRVRIGVSSPAAHGFKAHAWLESGGQVILGDDAQDGLGLDDFQVIWTLPRQ